MIRKGLIFDTGMANGGEDKCKINFLAENVNKPKFSQHIDVE